MMKSKIVFHDLKMEIIVKTGFVARYYGELMYIVYENNNCVLYFADNNIYIVESSLIYMMENLPEGVFVRSNRKTVLNICHCKEYDKTKSEIQMDNGKVFSLSRRNVTDFNAKRKSIRLMCTCTNCFTCKNCECEIKSVFCRRKNNGKYDEKRIS